MTKARMATVAMASAAAACLAAGAALAGSSVAPKTYKFSATYAGKSVVSVVDNNATIQSTAGVGTASAPVGKSKLSGAGKGVAGDPCGTFGGLGAITAVGGKLTFSIAPTGGSACGDESGQSFTISGRATVKGGTGKYAKAKGSFKFAGTFTRSTGAFTVKFIGTLTV